MLDRLHDYADCLADPDRWAIATIVEVSGSVPRPAGTSMAVRDDGRTIGSISGGCVEGAVVDAAIGCLDTGEIELHSFGYADDDGISVGLMCGGDVRVLVQPLRTLPAGILSSLAHPDRTLRLVRELPLDDAARNGGVLTFGRTIAANASSRARVLLPGDTAADLGDRVRAALDLGGAHVVEITDRSVPECPVARRLLVESSATPARLVIYGANDFSAALAQAAAVLGRHVTVCDARPVFATRARHPGAHEVVLAHPAQHFAAETDAGRIDSRTAIVVLTHDPRFDLPVLDRALRADLAYVGAMGSRVTHEKRVQELRAGGLADAHLDRLHSPIGLDLGARTPAEVAVSVLAELILVETAARTGITASPQRKLRDTEGDVHDARRVCAPEPQLVAPHGGDLRGDLPGDGPQHPAPQHPDPQGARGPGAEPRRTEEALAWM
jgi:xanthine dehydrogenase accessory factor